jgi:hypothetical protein
VLRVNVCGTPAVQPTAVPPTAAAIVPLTTGVPALEYFKFVPTREPPVRKAYELIEQADPKWRIALYGRADGELSQRFRNMPQNVTIRDVTLGDYSGTAVRRAIAVGDYETFEKMMAPQVDTIALWERLVGSKTAASRTSRSKKQAQR